MKLLERVIFTGVIAAVSVLTSSCATQIREEKSTRQVEESAPVDTAEQIRRRNAELLGTEITEERIKDDLTGKTIFAYGPEEGEGRQLDVGDIHAERAARDLVLAHRLPGDADRQAAQPRDEGLSQQRQHQDQVV